MDSQVNNTVVKFSACSLVDGSNPTHHTNGNITILLNKQEYAQLEQIVQSHVQKQPMKFTDGSGKEVAYPVYQLSDYGNFDSMIQDVLIQYWTDECSTSVI